MPTRLLTNARLSCEDSSRCWTWQPLCESVVVLFKVVIYPYVIRTDPNACVSNTLNIDIEGIATRNNIVAQVRSFTTILTLVSDLTSYLGNARLSVTPLLFLDGHTVTPKLRMQLREGFSPAELWPRCQAV